MLTSESFEIGKGLMDLVRVARRYQLPQKVMFI